MFRKTSLRLCECEWRKWWLEIYKKENDAKCVFLFLIGAARVRAPRALQQSQSEPAETWGELPMESCSENTYLPLLVPGMF